MKYVIAALVVLTLSSTASRAQFRSDLAKNEPALNTADAMKSDGDSFWSRLMDPQRFSMHQTYSMSFLSGGGGATSLGMFTNTFSYRASDDLFISADVSAVYSPYSSFGSAFQKSMDGIYLTNARLDWKLGDNTFMRVEYVGGPASGMYSDYSPYYNPFYTPTPLASPTGAPASKLPGH